MKKILLWLLAIIAILYFSGLISYVAYGHENGHAPGIMELQSGERTGWIEKADWCWAGRTRQNKIVLSIDEDRDDVVEVCCTLWYEHGRLHYILSDPLPDGTCECQGYVWFEGDSQGEELWDFYEGWKSPHSY